MSPQMKYKPVKTQNINNAPNCDCGVTMLQLQQMTFALVDLNLYLDMYPDNTQAAEDYNTLFKQYWEARSVYEQNNGPLMDFGHCPVSYPFNWVEAPWPWERVN